MIRKARRRLAKVLAVTVLLSACLGTTDLATKLQTDPSADSAEAARSVYSDRTFITHGLHGTQIEYHGPDGQAHLWYPGNRSGVPSNWKVSFDGPGNGHDICWQYPSSSRNGLTGVSAGGRFQCTPDWAYFPNVVQVVAGDPFRLNTGRVPFPLPSGKLFAEQLAQMARIPAKRLQIIYKRG